MLPYFFGHSKHELINFELWSSMNTHRIRFNGKRRSFNPMQDWMSASKNMKCRKMKYVSKWLWKHKFIIFFLSFWTESWSVGLVVLQINAAISSCYTRFIIFHLFFLSRFLSLSVRLFTFQRINSDALARSLN